MWLRRKDPILSVIRVQVSTNKIDTARFAINVPEDPSILLLYSDPPICVLCVETPLLSSPY